MGTRTAQSLQACRDAPRSVAADRHVAGSCVRDAIDPVAAAERPGDDRLPGTGHPASSRGTARGAGPGPGNRVAGFLPWRAPGEPAQTCAPHIGLRARCRSEERFEEST